MCVWLIFKNLSNLAKSQKTALWLVKMVHVLFRLGFDFFFEKVIKFDQIRSIDKMEHLFGPGGVFSMSRLQCLNCHLPFYGVVQPFASRVSGFRLYLFRFLLA